MVKNEVLQNLLKLEKGNFPVTSAYFMLDHQAGSRKTHLVELKNQIRYKKETSYFKELSDEARDSVLKDFEKIVAFYEEGVDPAQAVSAICFSSSGAGLWQTIIFKRPIGVNELVIQPLPYIRPLVKYFSRHRSYAAILIDKTKARIFRSSWGEFIELFSVTDNAPESIKVGGFKGRQERRVERNIHEWVIQHYKEIAQKTFEYYQQYNFEWLIIGGRRESINEFVKYLHTYPASKVAGYVEVEPSAPLTEVLEKVKELEYQALANNEHKLFEELEEKRQRGLILEGIKGVLQKFLDGWIETLYIQEDFVLKGAYCKVCGYLSLVPESGCPEHGKSMERTNDLIENILHRALKSSVNIRFVSSPMPQYDNIVGVLRFPLGA